MPSLRQSIMAKLLRCYPLYSGAGTLANSKLVATLAGTSRETVWCPTSGGEILAPLQDYVGRAAYYCGDLDPKISWVCKKLVNPGIRFRHRRQYRNRHAAAIALSAIWERCLPLSQTRLATMASPRRSRAIE